MGNLGSSLPGNVDIWREILNKFGGKLCLFVHKNIKIVFTFGGLLARKLTFFKPCMYINIPFQRDFHCRKDHNLALHIKVYNLRDLTLLALVKRGSEAKRGP